MTGFGHRYLVNTLVPPIQRGNVKDIYVIGGCDGTDPERAMLKDCMLSLPKTSVVLTMGCSKFRLLGVREQIGFIPNEETNIPRLMDAG